MLRVVVSWQINLSPQATSAQQTDYDLMAVLQRIASPRVSGRPQAVGSPVTKNTHPCRATSSIEGRKH